MADLGLGFRGNRDWTDLSDFVVHVTKQETDLLSILGAQTLKPGGVFGAARKVPEVVESQKSVCFSEIPLGKLSRLVQRRRSHRGIGFTKEFILQHGGGPVWYVEQGSPAQRALKRLIHRATRTQTDAEDPLWKLTPFVERPGTHGRSRYRFEWEREWRHVGPLRFRVTDVAFLLLEEHLHDTARDFFECHRQEQSGPAYLCAYIDPRWDESRVETAFRDWHKKYRLMGADGIRWIQRRWD